MLHNFISTQTPLLTDVSNIDKKDGADIKVKHLPSLLCYSSRDLPRALSLCWGAAVSYCRCHHGLPRRKRHWCVNPPQQWGILYIAHYNKRMGVESVTGRENMRKEKKNQNYCSVSKGRKIKNVSNYAFSFVYRLVFAVRYTKLINNILQAKVEFLS